MTKEEYEALKNSLNPEQRTILDGAEKAAADLSLDYLKVYQCSYEWTVGKYFDKKAVTEYAILENLLCDLLYRAAELRGVKFAK